MTTIKLRRGTAAEWATANPILNDGELGFERDTNKHKIGDGVTAWSSLDYFLSKSGSLSVFAKKKLHPAPRIQTNGHSRMHGSTTSTGGSTIGTSDQATLIANGLGIPLDQEAVSGTALYSHLSGADSWSGLVQRETRPSKFVTLGGVYALQYGINDVGYLGNTLAALSPYKHALRAIIARLRCSAIFEDTDSTVTLGGTGTWTSAVSTNSNSGATYSYNPSNGATATIVTPKSFPGGTMDVFFRSHDDGGHSVWTGPSSLGSPTLDSTEFTGTDSRRYGVMRIFNVPAGVGTYVFTQSSATGSAPTGFDCWGWEPIEIECPIIAVLDDPKPTDYSSTAADPAGPVTDTGIDNLRTITQAVVAEFGARVGFIDLSYLDKNAHGTFWEAVNIHYSATAHAYAAQQTLAFINSFDVQFLKIDLNTASATVATSTAWTNYTPTLTGITLGSGTLAASYRNAGDNVVDFYFRITLAADSVVTGPITVALPATMANAYSFISLDVMFTDTGTTQYAARALPLATTAVTLVSPGTNGAKVNVSATSPFTWAVGDIIDGRGRFRKA